MRVLALAVLGAASSAGNPLELPLLGWSTWNTFGCAINATLVRESIDALATSPLLAAGYNWVLIDDCWTECALRAPGGDCAVPAPRDQAGRIVVDQSKFPGGFEPLTAHAHSRGLRIGIYTSVSAQTCGGYTGSWGHEEIDAQTFVDWGFDFVKHDTCGTDYSVHDGGLQNATERMREGIFKAGKGRVVYYLDSGNPTSPQRVYNPHQRHVVNREALHKLAVTPRELVWVWATQWNDGKGPHMFKSWFDRKDTWGSMLTNLHNQARVAEYQRCGQFHMPDMLTLGMGGQSEGQYRAQFFTWAVLGAPLVMGNDIRRMDNATIALATAPEVLAVDQDPDCIQGSLARAAGATETWIKPLRDGSFAVVLLNKGTAAANATVYMDDTGAGWAEAQDFYPANFPRMEVRDLWLRRGLGRFEHTFTARIPAMDAAIYKMTPA
eukprot:TRINITY_DN23698_c0_g1_i2.p1 TRINITY_DN23698_c0_g1~~TRINITY_DN23698_c0_g1_i2.p1  ORF type:complete len:437 (+),score=147.73 TRINITY_DN23698_c0_g1_i2:72-1382(+)